jgi:flagellar basal-body rod protein FlgG
MEFKTLLYETIAQADLDPANRTGRPVNLQIGHGVRPIATARIFSQGNLERTDNSTDIAIEGDGFLVVERNGEFFYTKDGAMKASVTDDGSMLVTSEGYPILDLDDSPLFIPSSVTITDLLINEEGELSYRNTLGQYEDLGLQIKLVQFANPQGLEAMGSNLLRMTSASGPALVEADGETNRLSRVRQGVLEMSNVQVAEEMVSLIVAQRAFDINSKAITTSDEMLTTVNSLKR